MQKSQFNHVKFVDGNFKLIKDDLPRLEENQVLIKVCYTSVNEYDKILMQNKKKADFVMGAQGSGIIEDIAEGLDQNLKGRKVAFCHDGWSQYVVKDQDDLLFLDNSVDLKIAADAIVNPMTALCLRKIVQDINAQCVVIDGPITSLGRMLIKLFIDEDIQCIPIVRETKDIDSIKSEQLTRIIDLSKKDQFQENLRKEAYQFDKCCYISMCGGDIPGKILTQLPPKSEMIMIGNLSEQDFSIPCQNFFFDCKKIRGFFLERYVRDELDENTMHKYFKCIADDLKSGGNFFGTKVAKEMKLEEWDQALNQVGDKSLDGKIVLACN